jgi:hypothetical protein
VSRRRILLDENMPIQLRRLMPRVEAVSTEFMGWKGVGGVRDEAQHPGALW